MGTHSFNQNHKEPRKNFNILRGSLLNLNYPKNSLLS